MAWRAFSGRALLIHPMIPLLLPLLLCAAQDHGIKFDDVAATANCLNDGWGRGTAMVDFDNDGLLDLYSTSVTGLDAMYRQDPANPGTFLDVTVAWGIIHDGRAECGTVAADFDSDGDLDLFIPCGGNPGPQKDRMWRNDLNTTGKFTDVFALGLGGALASLNTSSFGATTLDADQDGDLDLFIANNRYTDPGTGAVVYPPNTLMINNGGFMFSDQSVAAGFTALGDFRHCGAADMNNDGLTDIGVGDFEGEALFYLNNGNGTFTEVHNYMGVVVNDNNFGVVFEDLNYDGWMDIIIPRFRLWTQFYLNNKNGTFRKVTQNSGIVQHDVMGHTAYDMDLDGCADLFLGTGHASSVQPDVFYLMAPYGNGIKVHDFSYESRINSPGLTRNHGQAIGDINGDLWPDVYFCNGGPPSYPNSNGVNSLFVSRGNHNHRIKVGVRGVDNNLNGIGAKISAIMPGGRSVHRAIQAGKGFCNTDESAIFLGLGADTSVDFLQILWPNGAIQRVLIPAVDAAYQFTETGISLTGTPAVGGPMDLQAHGTALDTVELLWSTSTDFVVTPSLGGVLELGAPYLTLATVNLDATGHYNGSVTLPNDPNLAGTSIYLQGHFMNASQAAHGLSNRVKITLP